VAAAITHAVEHQNLSFEYGLVDVNCIRCPHLRSGRRIRPLTAPTAGYNPTHDQVLVSGRGLCGAGARGPQSADLRAVRRGKLNDLGWITPLCRLYNVLLAVGVPGADRVTR